MWEGRLRIYDTLEVTNNFPFFKLLNELHFSPQQNTYYCPSLV